MDAEIPLPMCANLYQYQICIPEQGKCQEEKKEKLMVRIGETNPINQTQLFFCKQGVRMEIFLAEGPHRFNLLGKLRAFAFNKRASCNGYMN